MKYCPYCGAAIADSAASFCAECGKTLPIVTEEAPGKKRVKPESDIPQKKKHVAQDKRKSKKKPLQHTSETKRSTRAADDSYDGYYDDVLSSDMDRQKEGLDKELIKKVAVIAGGVLLIAGLCVLALYIL